MTRRALAFPIAVGALVVLVALLFVVQVPYYVLSPGPVCNTVGAPSGNCPSVDNSTQLITVPAPYDHPSTSHLGFTTVSEQTQEPSAATALYAWLSASKAVVPREVIDPPGESSATVQKQDTTDMTQAQDNAVTVAEAALHLTEVQVASVSAGPATGVLKAKDVLIAVNGTPTPTDAAFLAATASTDTSTVFSVDIQRDGADRTVALHKALVNGKPIFGVEISEVPSVDVQITLNPQVIGGPSAGLMFALGVYDRLSTGDLTGTTVVAGTGTIDDDGNVGAIGGIQQKMYAARHSFHATVFLAPVSNCSDVRGSIPKGLRVVPVSTFTQALSVLGAVRDGTLAAEPSC